MKWVILSLEIIICMVCPIKSSFVCLFIYLLVFYIMPCTILVILCRVARRPEDTSIYIWSRFYTVVPIDQGWGPVH